MAPLLLAPHQGRFFGPEHRFALRVYFEDTDFSGIVYHANYLRYFERARSDMLRAAGIDQRAAHEAGEGVYAVSHMDISFRAPARFDDILTVRTRLTTLRAASCHMAQRIERDGEAIAAAEVTAVFLTPGGRPRRQPPEWTNRFKKLTEIEN